MAEYHREKAIAYARKWALSRNPKYYDFDPLGGDCTNFISQALFAGSGVMNYTPTFGWYYLTLKHRAPAWTGVDFLYKFLVNNKSAGPYAAETDAENAAPGDIIQLDFGGGFAHSLVILSREGGIHIAAHTFDALDRPLDSYTYQTARFLHIAGVRE